MTSALRGREVVGQNVTIALIGWVNKTVTGAGVGVQLSKTVI